MGFSIHGDSIICRDQAFNGVLNGRRNHQGLFRRIFSNSIESMPTKVGHRVERPQQPIVPLLSSVGRCIGDDASEIASINGCLRLQSRLHRTPGAESNLETQNNVLRQQS
jgi:hypothetical protein